MESILHLHATQNSVAGVVGGSPDTRSGSVVVQEPSVAPQKLSDLTIPDAGDRRRSIVLVVVVVGAKIVAIWVEVGQEGIRRPSDDKAPGQGVPAPPKRWVPMTTYLCYHEDA